MINNNEIKNKKSFRINFAWLNLGELVKKLSKQENGFLKGTRTKISPLIFCTFLLVLWRKNVLQTFMSFLIFQEVR